MRINNAFTQGAIVGGRTGISFGVLVAVVWAVTTLITTLNILAALVTLLFVGVVAAVVGLLVGAAVGAVAGFILGLIKAEEVAPIVAVGLIVLSWFAMTIPTLTPTTFRLAAVEFSMWTVAHVLALPVAWQAGKDFARRTAGANRSGGRSRRLTNA